MNANIKNLALSILLSLTSCSTANQLAATSETMENNPAESGMCFDASNVVEEYELDNAFAVRYTDFDANCEELEILLDSTSYTKVCSAIATQSEYWGTLQQVGEVDGTAVFTIIEEGEEELELNTCSYARQFAN